LFWAGTELVIGVSSKLYLAAVLEARSRFIWTA
jgi:hypothetical protein